MGISAWNGCFPQFRSPLFKKVVFFRNVNMAAKHIVPMVIAVFVKRNWVMTQNNLAGNVTIAVIYDFLVFLDVGKLLPKLRRVLGVLRTVFTSFKSSLQLCD